MFQHLLREVVTPTYLNRGTFYFFRSPGKGGEGRYVPYLLHLIWGAVAFPGGIPQRRRRQVCIDPHASDA